MGDIRRISVSLSATLGSYARTMVRATVVTDRLSESLDQLAMKSKAVFSEVDDSVKGFGDEVEKTERRTKTSLGGAGKAVSDFDRLVRGNLRDEGTAFEAVGRSIDQYKAKIASLKDEANRTGSGSVVADLKKAQADLAKLEGFARNLGPSGASQAVSDFDRLVTGKLRGEETAFEAVSRSIDLYRVKIVDLKKEANRTGSDSAFGDLRKAKADLGKLEGFAKDLGTEVTQTLEKSGAQAGSSFTKEFAASFSGAAGYIIPVLVGLAAEAVPAVVSVVGSAFATAVGVGGVAVGLREAAQNPQVKAGIASLGKELSGELTDATSSFVGPALAGIETLKTDFATLSGGGLKDAFGSLATNVPSLVAGFSGFVTKFLPGLESAFRGVSPLLHELGNDLPGLGQEIGEMFDKFGHGGAGAVYALRALIQDVGGLASALGSLYQWSTKTFLSMEQEIVHVNNAVADFSGVLGHLLKYMPGVGGGSYFKDYANNLHHVADGQQASIDSAKAMVDAYGNVSTATDGVDIATQNWAPDLTALSAKLSATAVTAETLAGAMTDKLLGSMLNNAEAALHFHEALTKLDKKLLKGKDSLNINTAAGQANREAVLAAVKANLEQYDTLIATGASAASAAKAYDAGTASIRHQLHVAGLHKSQIDALVGAYAKVPDKVNTDVATNGLTQAINDLDTLLRQLNHLPPLTTITVQELYRESHVVGGGKAAPTKKSVTRPTSRHLGGPISNAAGGIYTPAAVGLLSEAALYSPVNPGRYMIAEGRTGGEGFVPRYGNYRRSTQIIDTEARWYGGRFAPGGSGGGAGSHSTYAPSLSFVVNPKQANWSVHDQLALQATAEAMMQVGRAW